MKRLPFMPIASYLLAGAVVTYLVALLAHSATPAVRAVFGGTARPAVPREVLAVAPPGAAPPFYSYRGRTLVKTYWQFSPGPDAARDAGYVGHLDHIGFPFRAASVLTIAPDRKSGPPPPTVSRVQRGLPIEGTALRAWNSVFSYRSALTYNDPCLPLRLLPLGFIADTAIYALLLFGLMHLFRRARSRRRARRSICTRCKYPVRDLATCPECGTTVPTRRAHRYHA